MELKTEIFVPIIGYEGYYEISNHGRVKALAKTFTIGLGRKQSLPDFIMKGGIGSHGYHSVSLQVNGLNRTFTTHRLVAKYFINRVEGKNLVNHKDGNKLNNYFENLEWTDHSGNIQHAYDNGLRFAAWTGVKGKDYHLSKPILQYDLQLNPINEWESAAAAGRELQIRERGIRSCCVGYDPTYKGFIWKYKV